MEKKFRYGFIGMGNMGSAMLRGLLKTVPAGEIVFTDMDKKKAEETQAGTGVLAVGSSAAVAAEARCLVFAVKPQQYDALADEIRDVVEADQMIISIAPGITIADVKKKLKRPCRVLRAMPNTPALVGAGMSGISFDTESVFSETEKKELTGFFASFGRVEIVPEKLMNAVVCVSGSSPAYVFLFIEALADGAVRCGLPRQQAYEMAAQSVLGSAKLLLETGMHPGALKDMVCSPAGTTIEAVAALEAGGFRAALLEATAACYRKCTSF